MKLTVGADGNIAPLYCGGGGLVDTGLDIHGYPINELAWDDLLPGNGGLFAVGPVVQQDEVQSLVCNDPEGTFPITASAFYIADAYYGWGLTDLSDAFYDGGC
ncbi:MAG: hypothetical protein WA724_09690 [Candidatus Dormiibacterota bacterium]